MVGVVVEFGRAAQAGGAAGDRDFELATDVATQFREEAASTLSAWAAVDLNATVDIGLGSTPATFGMNANLIDTTVHGWDVAKTLGRRLQFPEELSVAVLDIAQRQVNDDIRKLVGFDPPVDVADGADATDRLIAFLGRWP